MLFPFSKEREEDKKRKIVQNLIYYVLSLKKERKKLNMDRIIIFFLPIIEISCVCTYNVDNFQPKITFNQRIFSIVGIKISIQMNQINSLYLFSISLVYLLLRTKVLLHLTKKDSAIPEIIT